MFVQHSHEGVSEQHIGSVVVRLSTFSIASWHLAAQISGMAVITANCSLEFFISYALFILG
jgi:hypothetical protein